MLTVGTSQKHEVVIALPENSVNFGFLTLSPDKAVQLAGLLRTHARLAKKDASDDAAEKAATRTTKKS